MDSFEVPPSKHECNSINSPLVNTRESHQKQVTAVPLITPRYQKKYRFYRSMNVTDSIPETKTPSDALQHQASEEIDIQNGPFNYKETVHFHTYNLFRHGKGKIVSRSVGYSSDKDLVMFREEMSEASDVDTLVKKNTTIYSSTVLNPRSQAPLTDSELQSKRFRRFKKKYPGIHAPRNRKIRNRLMNDFFATSESRPLLDKAREFREEGGDEVVTRPFFGPLPKELEDTFDIIRDEDAQAAERYWTLHPKVAATLDPDSAEARLQLLNTRLRSDLQRALSSEFLSKQIADLEATFTQFIERGESGEKLVMRFRDGYGRLVSHGVATYYKLLSTSITVDDGDNGEVKLVQVGFPKARKGVSPMAPLPLQTLTTALGPPCPLPRHALSVMSTPNNSPAINTISPMISYSSVPGEPLTPLDLGPSVVSSKFDEGRTTFEPQQGTPITALLNSTVVICKHGEAVDPSLVPPYEPQLCLHVDPLSPGKRIVMYIASAPQMMRSVSSTPQLTQTQRKKMRKAEREQKGEDYVI